ncbi:MAG: signal recognition particle protein [Deltaproteobacteria bacterium]|nr:signal recognition particle protein [Deltaproteobacteria bacterium]
MLETLTQGFRNARNRLKGFRELSEATVNDAIRDIRISLLEADVEYHVVSAFLKRVKDKALGEVVLTRVAHKGRQLKASPTEHFVKICHDELVALMGTGDEALKPGPGALTTILMAGLQGSGKTTTAAKLAGNLKAAGQRPLLVAADVYRPAAVQQLQVLGQRLEIPVFTVPGVMPPELCERALAHARDHKRDVVIFDTAGRLAIDEFLMAELEDIVRRTRVANIFLVVDAMIGQDAVATAREFNRRLELDGVVLTKLDGDARGGAALSVRAVTGKPIKYVGMGEGLDRLEVFRPEGLASRILGFGDVVGLMQDFEKVVDEKKAEEDAERMFSGQFTLLDFLEQIRLIKKMGSLKDLMEKLPMFPDGIPEDMNVDDKALTRIEAIIHSMTPRERTRPELIDAGRTRRIARGSGTEERAVADLLGRFRAMKEIMTRVGKNPGLLGRIPGFRQLAQAQAMKGVKMEDVFPTRDPMAQIPGEPGAQRKPMRAFDKAKARKKAKMARQDRKKQKKKKKKK